MGRRWRPVSRRKRRAGGRAGGDDESGGKGGRRLSRLGKEKALPAPERVYVNTQLLRGAAVWA